MSITTYASDKNLDKNFGATNYTPPATYYVGLSASSIGVSGSTVYEPTTGSYLRVALTNDKTEFSVASGSIIRNLNDITFAESSAAWGTMVDVFLADNAATGSGNIWYYEALPVSKTVQENTVVVFSASSIVISTEN